MKLHSTLIALLLFGSTATIATASPEPLVCPDLSSAVQLAPCPTEEELAYTFKGYCSDNSRMYDRGTEVCTDYKLYREMKNIALWETRDGKFDGYVSCKLGSDALKAAKAQDVKVSKQGSVTRVACDYGNGLIFTHRTKAKCTADAANCATDSATCKAVCE